MTTTNFGHSALNIEAGGPTGAEPLLLLHGWGSSTAAMHPLAQTFSPQYRTYTVDLPGHGHSPPPPEPWGLPEHAAMLRQLITERIQPETGRDAVTIIGHSNGGRIGLYMASTPEHAALVRRLVLISPSGIAPQRTWRYHMRSKTAKAIKAPFEHLPDPLREPALDWLRHSLVWRALGSSDYNALEGVMRETFVKTVTHHLDGPVHRIDVPTLILWGTDDEAISRQQVEALEEAIPDAGLVELDGAGHYGQLDDPQTVIAATRYFLENT